MKEQDSKQSEILNKTMKDAFEQNAKGMKKTGAQQKLEDALEALKQEKPEERGELARHYAIAITELEKTIAYYRTFIAAGG